jgi:hypothetical protein
MIGPPSICLGVELEAARLRVARTLDRRPPTAPLGGFARAVVALVPAAVFAAGPGRAGQVDQEREPGRVDPCGHLGPGVAGGLPVQGAVRPAGDLVRHIRARRPSSAARATNRLLWYRFPAALVSLMPRFVARAWAASCSITSTTARPPAASRLVGHSGTTVTERVYRHEIRPSLTQGAEVMDKLFR